MPIYTYRCTECDNEFDAVRSIGDHLTECPECDGDLRHVYGTFRFRFRSRNWQPYSVESSEKDEKIKEEICVSGD
jgi:putative FmdB family regulatory protein